MLRRTWTALLAGSLVLAALMAVPTWPLALLVSGVFVLAALEMASLTREPVARVSLLAVLWFLSMTFPLWTRWGAWPAVAWGCVLTLGAGLAVGQYSRGVRSFWVTLLLPAFFAVPLAAVCLVHFWTTSGVLGFRPNLTLMLALPVWLGDTAALLVGRSFGRNRLAPDISPNKTWEGALTNLGVCVGAALLIAWNLKIGWAAGLWIGVIAGILGQVGDLVESSLKRAAGVKDSGFILPGHGGVLDRLDSLALSFAPSTAVLLALLPQFFDVKRVIGG